MVRRAGGGADGHGHDGGDQCLQEVLAGRVDVYICDGAEGLATPAMVGGRRYLTALEELTATPIFIVSVGARRQDTIILRHAFNA